VFDVACCVGARVCADAKREPACVVRPIRQPAARFGRAGFFSSSGGAAWSLRRHSPAFQRRRPHDERGRAERAYAYIVVDAIAPSPLPAE
jgi:hypothetical protein